MLVGMALLFSPFCLGGWAEEFPLESEPSYPDSLDQVRVFHEDYLSSPSSMKFDSQDSSLAFSQGDILQDFELTLFGDREPQETFRGVVAINTDKHSTVTCDDQLEVPSTDMNLMDIDVSKIIVISINTARGGNAIATSEIVIQPTQNNSESP